MGVDHAQNLRGLGYWIQSRCGGIHLHDFKVDGLLTNWYKGVSGTIGDEFCVKLDSFVQFAKVYPELVDAVIMS